VLWRVWLVHQIETYVPREVLESLNEWAGVVAAARALQPQAKPRPGVITEGEID